MKNHLEESQIDKISFNAETEILIYAEGFCKNVRIYVLKEELDECISGKLEEGHIKINVGFYDRNGYEQNESELLVLTSFEQVNKEDFEFENEDDIEDVIADYIHATWIDDLKSDCQYALENYEM